MKADDFSRCGYGATDGSASQQLINTDLGGMACRADRTVRRDRRLAGLDVGNAQVAQRVGGDAVRGAGKGQA